MSFWRTALRRWLERRGLALLRLEGPTPPSWQETLRRLRTDAGERAGVCCLDSELQTQTALLGVFPEERIAFAPDFAAWQRERPEGDWPILVVDPENTSLSSLLDDQRTRRETRHVLVRASLGFFWFGNGDAGEIARACRADGFVLCDVLGQTGLLTWGAPTEPVLLVFTHQELATHSQQLGAGSRVTEALAVLSPPLARSEHLQRLAGRGSHGFASGLLNPGAARLGERTILLARGERRPWAAQKVDEVGFVDSACPVLMERAPNEATITLAAELTLTGGDETERQGARAEDFRLFRFRDEIYSNFALTSLAGRPPQKNRRLELSALTTCVGLARLEPAPGKLTFLGVPRIDRPTRRVEKNWAMFEAGGKLHLLYSFQPYRLLRADRWPTLEFSTVQERELRLPPDVLPTTLRNSVNPVEYSETHLLHVVHAVFPTKRYAFWAVLIEKSTLLPVMVSTRPLVCGWRSAPVSILYVTAVVAGPDEIEIYGGLNDSSIGCWTLRRNLLDAAWLPLDNPARLRPDGRTGAHD